MAYQPPAQFIPKFSDIPKIKALDLISSWDSSTLASRFQHREVQREYIVCIKPLSTAKREQRNAGVPNGLQEIRPECRGTIGVTKQFKLTSSQSTGKKADLDNFSWT